MSEMVERVARAIDQSLGALIDLDGGRLQGELDLRLALAARAAIAAMREPTEAMLYACTREQADFKTGIGWQVMIDEALK